VKIQDRALKLPLYLVSILGVDLALGATWIVALH